MCPPKLPVILCSRGAPSKPGPNAQAYRQTMTLTSPGTVMLASRLSCVARTDKTAIASLAWGTEWD